MKLTTVLADPDRRCPGDQYAGRFLQEETEETEITEVNKLVAFSPPLCFLCLLLFPLSSRTANGASSSAPVGFSAKSQNNLSISGASGFASVFYATWTHDSALAEPVART